MRWPLALAAIVLPAAAQAQDFDCSNWDTLPQQGLNHCTAMDYQAADKELNAIWPKVMAEAKARDDEMEGYHKDLGVPSTADALRAAQRAWITFRDRQCELESYDFLGGTAQPMIASSCLAEMTRKRTAELKQIFLETGR